MALTDGLYGYWKLDETSGNAADSTGNGYTGTCTNITYTASGKVSRCYTFNGSTSHVYLGNVIKPTTAVSFSFWFKTTGTASEAFFIEHTEYDGAWKGFRCSIYDNGAIGILFANGNDLQMLDAAYSSGKDDDQWHHVLVTFNGTTVYIYFDGTKNSGWSWPYTIAYVTSTPNLAFGSNSSGGLVLDGEMDEIAIWNRALSDTEASDLYNSGSGSTYPWSTTGELAGTSNGVASVSASIASSGGGLVGSSNGTSSVVGITLEVSTLTNGLMGWWGLDEQTGNTCYDDTPNNLDGTGANITYGTNGVIDDCYTFNGTSSYVGFGAVAQPTSGITISAWIRLSGHPAEEKWIIHNEQYSTNWYGYRLTVYQEGAWGYILMNGAGSNLDIYVSTDDVADGYWHHVVITWNGTTAYHYTDNVKATGGTWVNTIAYSTAVLEFGRALWSSKYFGGNLDLVGIWNRALTDAEVSALYAQGLGLDYPFQTGGLNVLQGMSIGVASLTAQFVGINTYYIDPNGSDSTGNGSITNPWYRLSYACSQVTSSGYTIHVNPGTYTDNNRAVVALGVSIDGDHNTPPTINVGYVATGGADAYLSMRSSAGNAVSGNHDVGYVNFDGNLTGTRAVSVQYRSNTVFHHCNFTDFYYSGIRFSGWEMWNTVPTYTRPTGNKVYSCNFDNCTQWTGVDYEAGHIRLQGQNGTEIYYCSFDQRDRATGENTDIFAGYQNGGIQIHHNTFWKNDTDGTAWNFFCEFHYSHGGWDVYSNIFNGAACWDAAGQEDLYGYGYGLKFHHNTFQTTSAPALDIPVDGEYKRQAYLDLESFTYNDDIYVYNNHFKYCRIGIQYNNNYISSDNVWIYNNIIEEVGNSDDNYSYGIQILNDWDEAPRDFSNVHILHNVIDCGANAYGGIQANLTGDLTNCDIRNNIINGNFNYPIRFNGRSGYTPVATNLNITHNVIYGGVTNNLTLSSGISYVGGDHDNSDNILGSNPLFVGGSPYDFHLSSTSSPAYHAGYSVGLISDYDGNAWASPYPSIGAYEYGTTSVVVPDTYDFCLSIVVAVVNPTTDDLDDCFADAIASWFDPVYEGDHDRLSNFRNYGAVAPPAAELQGMINGVATVSGSFASSLVGMSASITITFSETATLGAQGITLADASMAFTESGTLTAIGVLIGQCTLSFTEAGVSTAIGVLTGQCTLIFSESVTITTEEEEHSTQIEAVDIVSYPWFSGDQPGLGTSKQNIFVFLYKTGINYNPVTRNVTRYVKKQSDNSDMFNFGATNVNFVNTQKLVAYIIRDNYDCETLLSPQGFYFGMLSDSFLWFTNNSSITINSGLLTKNFDLVAGTTTPTTLTVSPTSVEFLSNGVAVTDAGLSFYTTPTGGYYYVLITDSWISIANDYSNSMADNTVSVAVNSGVERTGAFVARSVCGKVDKTVTILQRAAGYQTVWKSYISLSFNYLQYGTLYFICKNESTTMNSQSQYFYWEVRDEYGSPTNSGNFNSGTLNAQATSNPSAYAGSGFHTLYGRVDTGDWQYLASFG